MNNLINDVLIDTGIQDTDELSYEQIFQKSTVQTKKKIQENNLPFSDKYRPKKLEDLIINKIIHKKISDIIKNRDIPNIIFTGKSGVGKTSTIHCISRKIYPREDHDSIIELNASDDRGIKSVHETIINFCKRKWNSLSIL